MTDPDDERYRIPGTVVRNATAWIRDNTVWPAPEFGVGDRIVGFFEDEITEVGKDCDGSPLFVTANHGHGWSAASLIPLPTDADLPEGEKYVEVVVALRLNGWRVEPPGGAL